MTCSVSYSDGDLLLDILVYYDCDVFGDLLGRQYSKVCDVFGDLLGRQTACGLRDYYWNMKNKELILEIRVELMV